MGGRMALAGMIRGGLMVGVLVASAMGSAPASAGTPTVRMVDDDGHAKAGDCAAAKVARTSIQAAITASGPGDIVQVCPGTYRETIVVAPGREGLTVRAVGTRPALIKRPAGADVPSVTVENDETHWVGHD